MSGLWTPGMQVAPMDELVDRLLRQIRAFGEDVSVEVELHDGAHYLLESLAPEPGYGFVTLRPHPEPGDPPYEVIVPLGSIVRLTLRHPEHARPGFGFSLPADG